MKYIIGFITLIFTTTAMAQLTVMISGGFQGPYQQMLPQFEKMTGMKVTTLSGASQGSGPKTIKAQLDQGVKVDLVILSREGLTELMEQGKIMPGTDIDLAIAPLGAAVPAGTPKPDIATIAALKQSLLYAKSIAVPGSTSGIYLTNQLFPQLGIADQILVTVTERGSQATALLAAGKVSMAVQPTSELVNIPGIEFIGRLPKETQLMQTFSAAILTGSTASEAAQQLIQLLSSSQATQAIIHSGMDVIEH